MRPGSCGNNMLLYTHMFMVTEFAVASHLNTANLAANVFPRHSFQKVLTREQ